MLYIPACKGGAAVFEGTWGLQSSHMNEMYVYKFRVVEDLKPVLIITCFILPTHIS